MDHTIPVARDHRLLGWLATLGYEVACPRAADDVFVREAQQWGLPPHELARIVRETFRMDVRMDTFVPC